MKKAIIVLTLLSLITMGFCVYVGIGYAKSLDTLNEVSRNKSEIINTNTELETNNNALENDYEQKIQDLLDTNEGCRLWENQNEILKQIKE